jgi:hypothetical protein
MAFESTTSLKIYRSFKAIDPMAWGRLVRYYERYEDDIAKLDFEEYFDCLQTYTGALFESGQSSKHLVMAEAVIRAIFDKNVRTWHGEDVFATVLFQKAASHFNLDEHARAEHILRELLKMRPDHELAEKLLFRCFRAEKPAFLHKTRVWAMCFFLLAVPIIAFDIVIVRPFFSNFETTLQIIWWSLFAGGWVVLAWGDGWNYLRAKQQVRQIVQDARLKKRSK